MPKRHAGRGGGSCAAQPLWRCLLFWTAPVGFLLLTLANIVHASDGQSDVISSIFPTIGLLAVLSVANLLADCWFHCRGSLVILQLLVQGLVILNHMDLVAWMFSSGAVELAPTALPVVQGGQPLESAPPGPSLPTPDQVAPAPDSHPKHLPLLARGRHGPKSLHQASATAAVADPDEPERISIVLPCLNETKFVIKTVNRFCERTPNELLQEIIVVDDGSSPPLEGELKKHGVDEKCRLKVLRHDHPWGLMIAKQTGGDAASGKYIGFYDCHVAPAEDWYKETMSLLKASPRRLVVPMIGDLDLDTWDERANGALTAKCYINFNADFWWYDDESDNIPVISGGLVATSRAWWQLSGGFDKGMRGWGGENTDQSLRAWLCGGDVLRAKSSRIAHMWRVPADKRTLAKYKLKTHTDNLGRVAAMWFDEFVVKFRQGGIDRGLDVSDGLAMRKRLNCKPFVFFLHRFRKIYKDGGLLPDKVFKIRHVESNKCLQRNGGGYAVRNCEQGTWFHMANQIGPNFPLSRAIFAAEDQSDTDSPPQVVCGNHKAKNCAACPQGHGAGWCHNDCVWSFGACVLRERFVREQKKATAAPCCSGIREWNTLDCFDQLNEHGPLPYNCDVSGGNANQQYLWDDQGRIRHMTGKCVNVEHKKVTAGDCESAAQWEHLESFLPEERKLYEAAVEKYQLTDDMPDH